MPKHYNIKARTGYLKWRPPLPAAPVTLVPLIPYEQYLLVPQMIDILKRAGFIPPS